MVKVTKSKSDKQVDWRSVCPVSSALDILGDKWSLLIIRDLLTKGPLTYSDFRESDEHIATNILADRLYLLTCLNIIERSDAEGIARNNAYKLTKSGEALKPTLFELAKWSQDNLKAYNPNIEDIV